MAASETVPQKPLQNFMKAAHTPEGRDAIISALSYLLSKRQERQVGRQIDPSGDLFSQTAASDKRQIRVSL